MRTRNKYRHRTFFTLKIMLDAEQSTVETGRKTEYTIRWKGQDIHAKEIYLNINWTLCGYKRTI